MQERPGSIGQPPTASAQAETMAADSGSLLEPLVAHLAELESTIREQAEQIGALRAENEALMASRSPVATHETVETPAPTPEPQPDPFPAPLPPTPNWRDSAWMRWLLAIIALLVIAAVALAAAWPR